MRIAALDTTTGGAALITAPIPIALTEDMGFLSGRRSRTRGACRWPRALEGFVERSTDSRGSTLRSKSLAPPGAQFVDKLPMTVAQPDPWQGVVGVKQDELVLRGEERMDLDVCGTGCPGGRGWSV